MSLLKKSRLGELIEVTRGASLSGEYYSTKGEYIRLTCGNFDYHNNCFKENTSKDNLFYTGEFREEFLLEKGDIITPLTEQAIGLLGTTARIPKSGKYIQSQDIALVKCKAGKIDPTFCYYLISSRLVRNQLSAAAQQTKIRHTSPDKIKACTVWVPELDEQITIGRLLASLDDKIHLNKRINDNLEAMARQLYDYWFVQFDFPNEEGKPYKSSGGTMVWNEKLKREIPKEWNVANVFDELSVQYGFPFSTELFTEEPTNIPIVRIRDILENSVSAYSEEEVDEKYKLQKQDLVIGMDGNFHMNYWNDNVSYLNQRSVRLRTKSKSTVSIMQAKYDIAPYIKAKELRAKGSTVGHLSDKDLKELFVLVSPNADFRNKLDSILAEIIENRCEMIELTKQRDELLPLLMNGQTSVNYHLSASPEIFIIIVPKTMKEKFIASILEQARAIFDTVQCENIKELLINNLDGLDITRAATSEESVRKANTELLSAFISAKKIEGSSAKTLAYYESTIVKMFCTTKKPVAEITTNDIRTYLAEYQEERHLSKVTVDNIRRIFSSFFSWLEDEDLILKSPVRRIHKVRTDTLVKETITDEQLEQLRDNCTEIRDLALIDLLASTGMRVGELVRMNRNDLNFHERQCIVFGKGNKEREVYFNARTKIHLQQYLDSRTDTNPALFVSLSKPYNRLTISGVEVRLRTIGNSIGLNKIHPHKFRRTLATMAIDKGMPIEQVQCILGHVKIDTTLHYAKVNQLNVKMSHRKYIG